MNRKYAIDFRNPRWELAFGGRCFSPGGSSIFASHRKNIFTILKHIGFLVLPAIFNTVLSGATGLLYTLLVWTTLEVFIRVFIGSSIIEALILMYTRSAGVRVEVPSGVTLEMVTYLSDRDCTCVLDELQPTMAEWNEAFIKALDGVPVEFPSHPATRRIWFLSRNEAVMFKLWMSET